VAGVRVHPHQEIFKSLRSSEHGFPEPSLHRSEIVGFIAGFGTTFAAIPDLVTMIRRRSSQGINPTMASIMAVFQIAWIYYGLLIVSRPVIVWNVVGVVTNSLTIWAYRSFARRERKETGG